MSLALVTPGHPHVVEHAVLLLHKDVQACGRNIQSMHKVVDVKHELSAPQICRQITLLTWFNVVFGAACPKGFSLTVFGCTMLHRCEQYSKYSKANTEEKDVDMGQTEQDGADRQWAPSNGATVNPGTLGHPQICCRPCVYLAMAGSCKNGGNCEYCHEQHAVRVPKLDKQQRQLIRTLNEADTLGLLLPYLTEKARTMPPSALNLVNYLERHLAALDDATGTVISHARLVKLSHVLENMSFIRILCLMPTVWSADMKNLLAQLRHEYCVRPDQKLAELN
ncbi:unnamed protein product [Symbiodinium natans]|uniref:C3H1-type domain-containing protein n=1 Tax=Symbiodinium natans TaxID=878477 RepID=A0A812KT12_9DINO|nr:unnamed protein product [Symbiodinium natans]